MTPDTSLERLLIESFDEPGLREYLQPFLESHRQRIELHFAGVARAFDSANVALSRCTYETILYNALSAEQRLKISAAVDEYWEMRGGRPA